jgi:hypothetical protein
MKKIIFAVIVFSFTNIFSQVKDFNDLRFTEKSFQENITANKIYSLRNDAVLNSQKEFKQDKFPAAESEKSPGLAMIYSLLVPGLGQVYTNRFDVGKYFMISEASLWLGYAAFTIYGNWLLNDAYDFAAIHAGVDNSGKEKDDQFYIDIANWDNYEQYNNEQLIFGQYDKLYDPAKGYYFYWDQVSNRKKYREDKLAADRTKNDRLFIVGAILVNHVVSAISAIILTNNYNNDIKKSSGGFSLNADVMKFGTKVDGVRLRLVKWF